MLKEYGTTLIIGNGFDLNLGMRTGYASFFQDLSKSGFFTNNKKYSLVNYIYNKGEKENWFDFEAIIEEFASKSEVAIFMKMSERFLPLLDKVMDLNLDGKYYNDICNYETLAIISPEINKLIEYSKSYNQNKFVSDSNVRDYCSRIKIALKKYIEEQRNSVKKAMTLLCEELSAFLNKANITVDYPLAIWIMWAVMGIYDSGLKGLAHNIINKYAQKDGTYTFPKFKIVSFNYTDTIGKISRKMELHLGMALCLDTEKLGDNFYRIHGNLDEDIVFGIEDSAAIPNAFLSLRKSQNISIDAKKRFRKILDNSNKIIILGHSLYGIDFEYYESFFNENNDTEIVILYHNDKSLQEIQAGLEDRGVTAKIKYVLMDNSSLYTSFCEEIANEQQKHFDI